MAYKDKFTDKAAFKIASVAVLSAVTAIFILMVRVPVAPTRGYIHLGEVAIFFTALVFGPVTAFIAGGLGAAIADVIGGYGQWAPISFIVHGVKGYVVGLVYGRMMLNETGSGAGIFFTGFVCFVAGAIVTVGGYFIAGVFMVGPGAAAVEIPGNILQGAAGAVGGVVLASAVKKAYPPVVNFRW